MVLALGPTACGFRPMYGRPDSASAQSPLDAELTAIRVYGIEDRVGQQLRNALVQRLTPAGEPASARYTLEVRLTTSTEGLAATKDGNTTLARSNLSAIFFLRTWDEGTPLFSGMARSLSTFRDIGPRYGSTALERDALERVMPEIAESIRNQLAVYFSNRERKP